MLIRRFLSAFLVLVMLATTGTVAAARMDQGTGTFEILCLNGTLSLVELDADGAPIAPRQHCPDCMVMSGVLPVIPTGQQRPGGLGVSLDWDMQAAQMRHAVYIKASARAPPQIVRKHL